jgi:uncharacterized protein (DUF2141 family)
MRPLLVALSCAIFQVALSQNTLTIEVELNKPDAGGTVRIALCPSAQSYDSEKGCKVLAQKASGQVVRLDVRDLQEGRYAIKAFHDVNDSGEMDFNLIGIPKEPYGFSNDATATMSAPKFEQAAFVVKKGANKTRFRMRG